MFPLIQVRELTKQYGDKLALDGVSFDIEGGQVVGLLGLNGAGKSTTMNILTGYISPTGGSAAIDGHDIMNEAEAAKRVTGYLPEQPAFYPEMTVREHLDFVCGLKGVNKDRKAHIAALCKQVGLGDMQGRMVRNLSKGYRQRLGFAQALAGGPKVVILDEPTVGLDPSQIIEMRQLIKDSGKHSTVIVSSHILTEIQAVCGRVILLHKGRLIADGAPGELAAQLGGSGRCRVRVQGEAGVITGVLRQLPGVKKIERLGQNEPNAWDFALEAKKGKDLRAPLFRALAGADLPLLSLQGGGYSLEEAFLNLTMEEGQAPEQAILSKSGNAPEKGGAPKGGPPA